MDPIRPLAPVDIDPLAAALADLPLLQRYRRGAAALAGDLRAALARGDGLLVWDEGAGARALCWYSASGTFGPLGGYLRLIAVTPGTTGQGIGAALLEAFERGVVVASRHAFLLVSDFNEGAQRFYERHGYTRLGAVPGAVLADVDEVIYWKRLR
jgi:ribosomal protein S18 acetylase RimI-like enzyme